MFYEDDFGSVHEDEATTIETTGPIAGGVGLETKDNETFPS